MAESERAPRRLLGWALQPFSSGEGSLGVCGSRFDFPPGGAAAPAVLAEKGHTSLMSRRSLSLRVARPYTTRIYSVALAPRVEGTGRMPGVARPTAGARVRRPSETPAPIRKRLRKGESTALYRKMREPTYSRIPSRSLTVCMYGLCRSGVRKPYPDSDQGWRPVATLGWGPGSFCLRVRRQWPYHAHESQASRIGDGLRDLPRGATVACLPPTAAPCSRGRRTAGC
jgi:hypothetical protein